VGGLSPSWHTGGACGGDGAERAVTLQGGSDHDENAQEVRSQDGGTAATEERPQAGHPTRPAKTNRRPCRAHLCRGSSTGHASPPNQAVRQTKKGSILALLQRPKGAAIGDLIAATGWQVHSVRAALTGLRKEGKELLREKDQAGITLYRIAEEG